MKTYKILKRTGKFESVQVEAKNEQGETVLQEEEREILEEVKTFQEEDEKAANLFYRLGLDKEIHNRDYPDGEWIIQEVTE